MLFKIVFIQALEGIKSMGQTCKKIKVDAEYRWFLGIPFGKETPHFSTFSKNYERRFKNSDIFEKIFVNMVNQAIKYNLIDGTIFYTDSTHKKANANKNKCEDEIIKNIKERRIWLEEEYGIEHFNIRNWINKYGSITISTGETTNNDEILKLRKELQQVHMENEILKKAVAIFSKEQKIK